MKITVLPRYIVEHSSDLFRSTHILIVIAAPLSQPVRVMDNHNRLGLLRVYFNDTEAERDNCTLFNERHAKEIVDFVNLYKDKIDEIIVNCLAGYSRSPAIAAGIAKMIGEDDREFFKTYSPNNYVYSKMINYLSQASEGK
jgi:predicted protein tyrosine phosphatase